MILIDYSQVAISNIMQFEDEIIRSSNEKDKVINIIRHAILTSIKHYKKKYGAEYGELVIACDGSNYWRKLVFPYYKYGRKENRDNSKIDWGLIFSIMAEIRVDLIEHFPYKVIHFDKAEADDIIGVLCKWTQENGFITRGLFQEQQKVLIISADGDFKQLQKYKNVKQWSPIQKKFVIVDDPHEYLMTHITKASDDGIPNVLSADDVFVNKIRQTPVKKERLQEFIELGEEACRNETERKNWKRNRTLIDLDYIPEDVCETIIHRYVNQEIKGNKASIMNYLIKKKCRLLLNEIEEF